jgi:phosphoribosyl-AMP cyclohydrolase
MQCHWDAVSLGCSVTGMQCQELRGGQSCSFIFHLFALNVFIMPDVSGSHLWPNFASTGGLLPAIAQDVTSGDVLMMAWMNEEAFRETLETGRAVYFSRSRSRLWRKGEESGHFQTVHAVYLDCDADTILLKVSQVGAACHEGFPTCFFRQVRADGSFQIVQERLKNPGEIYGKTSQ